MIKKTVTVLKLNGVRKSAVDAAQMYQENDISKEKRETLAAARKLNGLSVMHSKTRPNKKDRRKIMEFKHENH